MSTRTYTLNFLGASMLPLPQGRFFMIKSATAALGIVARRRDGQPVEFVNVGAGLQYNALEAGGKWSTLEVTSAAAQVVEIVISDEASVSFANTVTVSGGVATTEVRASAFTAPAAVALNSSNHDVAANPARRRITVTNLSDSPNSVFLQLQSTAGVFGIEIQPGMSWTLENTAAFRVRNNVASTCNILLFEET